MFYKYLISNVSDKEVLYLFLDNRYEISSEFSKDIKEEVLEKAKNNHMVTAFFQKDFTNFMIYKGEQIEIDKSLWNMDVFADVFFG